MLQHLIRSRSRLPQSSKHDANLPWSIAPAHMGGMVSWPCPSHVHPVSELFVFRFRLYFSMLLAVVAVHQGHEWRAYQLRLEGFHQSRMRICANPWLCSSADLCFLVLSTKLAPLLSVNYLELSRRCIYSQSYHEQWYSMLWNGMNRCTSINLCSIQLVYIYMYFKCICMREIYIYRYR